MSWSLWITSASLIIPICGFVFVSCCSCLWYCLSVSSWVFSCFLVSACTILVTSLPKCFSSCSLVVLVSSSVSCRRAAIIVVGVILLSFVSRSFLATASGWVMYSSPVFLVCPSWLFCAYSAAKSICLACASPYLLFACSWMFCSCSSCMLFWLFCGFLSWLDTFLSAFLFVVVYVLFGY